TRQGPPALTLMQQAMHFDLANGFPLITERSLRSFWRKSIGELCAFINGATTLAELADFGCDWWDPWATPEKTSSRGLPPGSLGPGSYGGAFRYFPTVEGGEFDQFRHLVEQITELPGDRTHFVSPWIPEYQVRGAGKTRKTTAARSAISPPWSAVSSTSSGTWWSRSPNCQATGRTSSPRGFPSTRSAAPARHRRPRSRRATAGCMSGCSAVACTCTCSSAPGT